MADGNSDVLHQHMAETCYMCEALATTKEHVPPKCLFPEVKDANADYRKQLISVPSCRLHNNRKCDDDSFLMISLAGIIGSNSIGYIHKFTKITRALRREAGRQLEQVFTRKKVILVKLEENKFIDVIWGTPDQARLEKCFDHISRGLYCHHHGSRFRGRTKSLLGFLRSENANAREFRRMVSDRVKVELSNKVRLGANPDVFTYQFTEPDQFNISLVHMQFYGGLDVFVSMIPDSSYVPPHLPSLLISGGVHTTIKMDDAIYTFNTPSEVA